MAGGSHGWRRVAHKGESARGCSVAGMGEGQRCGDSRPSAWGRRTWRRPSGGTPSCWASSRTSSAVPGLSPPLWSTRLEHPGRDVHPALPGGAGVEEALTFTDAAGWEAWLAAHHDQAQGVWVKVAKKGSAHESITAAEAGQVALCYGWIDSVRRAASDGFFLQRYSRRKPDSSWSRVNVDRAQALIAAGRMRAPGSLRSTPPRP